ncbi:beta-ketoacyl synthase chain length factor [Myxococcota bacterium]|nr:beta-ketoacyl synthase chain length factor [Myxococcota bacterium]MBU1899497.1 beta-ketoacyl synthase chain length factor [Myxococcota bacterium]
MVWIAAFATSETYAAPPARFEASALRRLTAPTALALPLMAPITEGVTLDETVGLVAGLDLADLSQTMSFLEGYQARGPRFASPQSFQRSVHGAMAGELAILYGLRGWNMTVTQGPQTGAAALYQAWLALRAGRCRQCLCVVAVAHPEIACLTPDHRAVALRLSATPTRGPELLGVDLGAGEALGGLEPLWGLARALESRPEGEGWPDLPFARLG